jgi:hypothetical protein
MAHIGSRFMNWFDPEPTSSATSSELARGWLRSRSLLVVFVVFVVLAATVLGVVRPGAPGLVAVIIIFILLSALTVALARRRGRRLVNARRD